VKNSTLNIKTLVLEMFSDVMWVHGRFNFWIHFNHISVYWCIR